MPPEKTYEVRLLEGVKRSTRRGVAVLVSTNDRNVNAAEAMADVSKKKKLERTVLDRMDYWVDGAPDNPKWFHGWTEHEYRSCYVHKWKDNRENHRLYGFLFHPMPIREPRFELCVLVEHAKKAQQETDAAILDRLNRLNCNEAVIAAVAQAFPDARKRDRRN